MSTSAVRTALVAIINGDASLQATMGRATDLVRAWADTGSATFPVIAYQLLPFGQPGANGNTWSGSIQLSAFADEQTGGSPLNTVEAIMDRLIDLVDYAAWSAQGLDAASMTLRRMDVLEDREQTRGVWRADLEIDMRVFYP